MKREERNLLYVHDYGDWHIAPKKPSRAPSSTALCGAQHQQAKPHWASQADFEKRGLMLILDDREVCSACITEVFVLGVPSAQPEGGR